MMLRPIFVSLLVSVAAAHHNVRCGNDSEVGTTFKKSTGDVESRYIVEWCSEIKDEATEWNLDIKWLDHNNLMQCPSEIRSNGFWINHLKRHSSMSEVLKRPEDFNCSHITCFSQPVDMVFSGCYQVTNILHRKYKTWQPKTTLHNVSNQYKSHKDFDVPPLFSIQKTDNATLFVNWYYSFPLSTSKFWMRVCTFNKTGDTSSQCSDVGESCYLDTRQSVICTIAAPQPNVCLQLTLQNDAPWRHGDLFSTSTHNGLYCIDAPEVAPVSPVSTDTSIWWMVGALAVVLTGLAAFAVAHCRLLARVRKQVLAHWLQLYSSFMSQPLERDDGDILLLYARDCKPAMDAIETFKDMLRICTTGTVYDIFEPECMQLFGPAPKEWLHGMLQKRSIRVVVVQTTAASQLYARPEIKDGKLQEPLLGNRVQYRNPHYSDSLLQYAFRLIEDTAYMQLEYTKYYIATISELPVEMMPLIAAYRRYELPTHARALLSDLHLYDVTHDEMAADNMAAVALDKKTKIDTKIQQLSDAVTSFVDYVRNNENYLKDELMFL